MKSRLNLLLPLAAALVAVILLAAALWTRPAAEEDMILITVDGEEYLRVPLSQPQTVEVRQDSGAVNVITVTERGAVMSSSTCENQLCVHMGEVTLDNWETRPNQEYIICLPNKVIVQLIPAGGAGAE